MQLYIIAGPNGVGKTAFASRFLPKYANCQNFINADLIAKGCPHFLPKLPPCVQAGWCSAKSVFLRGGTTPSLSRQRCQGEAT
jgi:hypothetical protein